MMNKSFPVLPVPEIMESNLNHSFKVRNSIIQFDFFVYVFVSFSSTWKTTTDESENHQNCTRKSAASSATVITKCMQYRSKIRLTRPLPHRRQNRGAQRWTRWWAASTITTKAIRISSSASSRCESWEKEVSGRCSKLGAGMMESSTQSRKRSKSSGVRATVASDWKRWSVTSSFPATSIVLRCTKLGNRTIFSSCKLSCAGEALRITSIRLSMFLSPLCGRFFLTCFWWVLCSSSAVEQFE